MMDKATTLSQFVEEMNEKFHWTLPVAADFPPDSLLHQVWEMTVKVDDSPDDDFLYKAISEHEFTLPNTDLHGKVVMLIRRGDDGPQPTFQ